MQETSHASPSPPWLVTGTRVHTTSCLSTAMVSCPGRPGTHLLVTCSNDKNMRVWDLDTGQHVDEPLLGHNDKSELIAASPDGRWVVSGAWNHDDSTILVWEMATKNMAPVSFKEQESNTVQSVVHVLDSETFASTSYDETVRVRRVTYWIHRITSSGKCAILCKPDGSKLAGATENYIIVWNTESGEEVL
ncbi:WD40 repeat-like protein [Rhizopogon vinicolor AM-OR11-026]|uniref:WD40 repeat-like protein n=1 Tax=Rhizopogon vinicolor AM-OR11-026 TaxID=1314800 RepID=A0A1B7NIF0_9AGAM|nr:WD40 repeat-like protein [Rhizopogon vinicolor AM-OR11-026]